jgi:8-oxo-dGTP diphosphatase
MPHLETKIGEYAIILNSKKEFLLLQFWDNHNNTWHFPGGRLEVGDQSIEALKREVKEETDLDIDNIKPFFTKVFDTKSPKYGVFFTAKVKEPSAVRISDEHQAYGWFSKSDLDSIDFKQPFYKELLEKVL